MIFLSSTNSTAKPHNWHDAVKTPIDVIRNPIVQKILESYHVK